MVERIAVDVHKSWHTELRKQEKGIGPEQWAQVKECDKELFRVAVKTVISKIATIDDLGMTDFAQSMGAVVGHSWHELKIPAGPMVPKDIHMYLAASKDGLIREDKLTVMLMFGYMSVLVGLQSGLKLSAKQVEAHIEALLHIAKKERER